MQAGNCARFQGDTETAARFYAKASDTRPDSWIPPYNLACLRAISGDPEQAMRLLDRVIHLGFTAPQLLDQNEDFASVRARPGWPELVARARRGGGRATPVRAGRHYGPR